MAEHLIPITISVDDETIEQKAMDYAAKRVAEDVMKATHKCNFYNGKIMENDFTPLREIIANKVDEFIEEKKDFIIESAIESLADKLSKTKKCKEMLNNLVNKVENTNEN